MDGENQELKEEEVVEKNVEEKPQENQQETNDIKEKTLEEEVLAEKDKRFIAKHIVDTNNQISEIKTQLNQLMDLLKAQSPKSSFTSSKDINAKTQKDAKDVWIEIKDEY